MTYLPSLKLNYLYSFCNTFLLLVFPLIIFPYASRILGPDGIGVNAFAQSFVNYFVLFSQLGIPLYGIREVARVKNSREQLSKTVWELVGINFIIAFIALVFLLIAVWSVPKLYQIKDLIFVYATLLLITPLGVEWCYGGLEQYRYITIRNFIFKLIALVVLFSLVKTKEDTVWYAGVIVLSSVGSFVCNFIHLHKYIDFSCSNLNLNRHFKKIGWLFMMSISTSIYVTIPPTILGFLSSQETVGFLTAASKIVLSLFIFSTTLGRVLLPRMSYHVAHRNQKQFDGLLNKSFKFSYFLLFFVVVFAIVYAPEIVFVLCGSSFIEAGLTVRLMACVILFAGLSNITGIQILIPLGYENKVTFSVVAGALFSIVLYCMFIPLYTYNACAVIMSLAELMVLVIQIYFLRKLYPVPFHIKQLLKNMFIAWVAVLLTLFVKGSYLSSFFILVLAFILSGILYIGMLFGLRDKFLYYLIDIVKKHFHNWTKILINRGIK